MMGAVVKRYFAEKAGVKPEDICLVRCVCVCTCRVHGRRALRSCSTRRTHTPTPPTPRLPSCMPCTAKKLEAEREEMRRPGEPQDIDYVLTTRELGHMLR